MSLILQIETATTSCSVALTQQERLLAVRELNQRNVHAEVITIFIDELMKQAGKSYHQLDAVAISSGPGSYTGLRIGVSTAKGLCYALDKPLIAVETLQAMADGMAAQLNDRNVLLCPMIDARRMEVYTALFDGHGNRLHATSAEIIDKDSFNEVLNKQQVLFFGDGAGKCREVLSHKTNALFAVDFTNSAQHLNIRASERYKQANFEDLAYFEPFYLKDFIAGKKEM